MNEAKQKLEAMRRMLKKKVVNHSPLRASKEQVEDLSNDKQSQPKKIQTHLDLANSKVLQIIQKSNNQVPNINIENSLKQKQLEKDSLKQKTSIIPLNKQINAPIRQEGQIDDEEQKIIQQNYLPNQSNSNEHINLEISHSENQKILNQQENIRQPLLPNYQQTSKISIPQPIQAMEIEQNQQPEKINAQHNSNHINEHQSNIIEQNLHKESQPLNKQNEMDFPATKQDNTTKQVKYGNVAQNSLQLIDYGSKITNKKNSVENQPESTSNIQNGQIDKLPELDEIKENKETSNEWKNVNNKSMENIVPITKSNDHTDFNPIDKANHSSRHNQNDLSHHQKDLSLHQFNSQNNSVQIDSRRKPPIPNKPATKIILKQLQMIKTSIHNLSVTYRGVEFLREEIRKDSILKRKIRDRLQELNDDNQFDVLRKLVKRIQSHEANVAAAALKQHKASLIVPINATLLQHNEVVQKGSQPEIPVNRENVDF